eukprot:TRINITY_DN13789_c0_g1_i1.p1 TRINITY_DN13789_c0_g1~~TRINITY_DN13789_c0_g1_i1.p1  ORF type:complete len:181 (-),score=44.74 TRINITY_DN13789_c0_g1_i1:76-579(-)
MKMFKTKNSFAVSKFKNFSTWKSFPTKKTTHSSIVLAKNDNKAWNVENKYPTTNYSSNYTTNIKKEKKNDKSTVKLKHYKNMALIGLVPLAFLSSGGPLATLCDIGFTVLVPIHAYYLTEDVLRDYTQLKESTVKQTCFLVGAVIATGFVLLSLDYGLTNSVKYLWN